MYRIQSLFLLILFVLELNGQSRKIVFSGPESIVAVDELSLQTTTLYEADAPFGSFPTGGLIEFNGRIWGTSYIGGEHQGGTIFSMLTDGTDFKLEYEFDESIGVQPTSGLTNVNGEFWGTLTTGPGSSDGAIYSFDPIDGNLEIAFSMSNPSGENPSTKLLFHEGFLWGTTIYGGNNNDGVVFRIDPENGLYEIVKHFNRNVDGYNPRSDLVSYNGKVWGTARTSSGGMVYTYNSALNFDIISYNSGFYPLGSVAHYNNRIYGVTAFGGNSGAGSIYSVALDGTGFTEHISFDGGNGDEPNSGLTLHGDKFYGVTTKGGSLQTGLLYSFDPISNQISTLHDFEIIEGTLPDTKPLLLNNELWFPLQIGGRSGLGTLVRYDLTTGLTVIKDFGESTPIRRMFGGLMNIEDQLFGLSDKGGDYGEGAIYKLSAEGGEVSVLHSFEYETGNLPASNRLTEFDGELYGTTYRGGFDNFGVIFKIEPNGSQYEVLHEFNSERYPTGQLQVVNGKLIGMTNGGGGGAIFSFDPSNNSYSVIKHLDFNSDGGAAIGNSVSFIDGKIWGLGRRGGPGNQGTIFSMDPDGSNFTVEHAFVNSGQPRGRLIKSNNKLWGMTIAGGNEGKGSIFNINTDGSGFKEVYSFQDSDGTAPFGELVSLGDYLYGYCNSDGEAGNGTLFRIKNDETGFEKLVDLARESGGHPAYGAPLIIKNSQEITFPEIADQDFDSRTLELNATVTSGLPITFESSNTSIASIIGSTVTFNRTGEITITASQSGNDYYYPTELARTFTIRGVLNVLDDSSPLFYPNPAKTEISIHDVEIRSVSIVDLQGVIIENTPIQNGVVDISEVSQGIYLLIGQKTTESILLGKLIVK